MMDNVSSKTRYGGRAVADRLEAHRRHVTFTDEDREFIETAPFFFLATAWQDNTDCSMKGGVPGFVQITAPNELVWPDYDGNRMYRSPNGRAAAISGMC